MFFSKEQPNKSSLKLEQLLNDDLGLGYWVLPTLIHDEVISYSISQEEDGYTLWNGEARNSVVRGDTLAEVLKIYNQIVSEANHADIALLHKKIMGREKVVQDSEHPEV